MTFLTEEVERKSHHDEQTFCRNDWHIRSRRFPGQAWLRSNLSSSLNRRGMNNMPSCTSKKGLNICHTQRVHKFRLENEELVLWEGSWHLLKLRSLPEAFVDVGEAFRSKIYSSPWFAETLEILQGIDVDDASRLVHLEWCEKDEGKQGEKIH